MKTADHGDMDNNNELEAKLDATVAGGNTGEELEAAIEDGR